MSDYEFRIALLEKETAHLRDMQALHSARVDAHQSSLDIIEGYLKSTNASLSRLTETVEKMSGKIDTLVSALLREHPNGKGEG